MEVVVTGHNFESILPKDHPCHVRFKLADWFQKRRLLNNFPIGSYVKTMSADDPIAGYKISSGIAKEILVLLYFKQIYVIFFRTSGPKS
jgi:hypothetical protein